jgi:hypothetical protein
MDKRLNSIMLQNTKTPQGGISYCDAINITYSIIYSFASLGVIIYSWDTRCNNYHSINFGIISMMNYCILYIKYNNKYNWKINIIYASVYLILLACMIYDIYALFYIINDCQKMIVGFTYATIVLISLNIFINIVFYLKKWNQKVSYHEVSNDHDTHTYIV